MAETSPPVRNTHFVVSELTLPGLMRFSAGWFREFDRSRPAVGHVAAVPADWAAELTAKPSTESRTAPNRAAEMLTRLFIQGSSFRFFLLTRTYCGVHM